MRSNVTFISSGLKISAHLYTPETSNGRTIIVGHPGSSVKEQSPALYARKLADNGFRVLTFDAAYQGESEGLPRFLENPAQRVEDFKSAASYLSNRPDVDPERLGILGICASGGYVVSAAAGDRRIKAVATIAAVNVGLQIRAGADGKQDPSVLDGLLETAARERTKAYSGGEMGGFPIFPATESPFGNSDAAGFQRGRDCDSSSGCGRQSSGAGWPISPGRRSAIRRI